jgi:hypothetical protein
LKKKHKTLAILIGSAIFTSAARFSYSYLHFKAIASHSRRVKIGATRQQVIDVIGEPNHHDGSCGSIHTAHKGCAREFVYSPPLAPLFDDYYVVSFGREDRVIDVEHYKPE